MTKYSFELKLKVVQDYDNGVGGVIIQPKSTMSRTKRLSGVGSKLIKN